jgi:hypothetical protein
MLIWMGVDLMFFLFKKDGLPFPTEKKKKNFILASF